VISRVTRLLILALVLALPGAAGAAEIRGVDTTGYPEVRFTVELAKPGATPPVVLENGAPVAGLEMENLGRAKSILLAVDRSVSMKGTPLENAIAAARAFVAAKPSADRIGVATFATVPVLLTGFSTSTIDADSALGSLTVDSAQGTTLYDALVMASVALAKEPLPGRVIIVVTDGNETRSEATLENVINAAHDAGVSIYVVGIESDRFTPEPLRRLAAETGGTYYGAASPEALTEVYASIAQELLRTWQVHYFTASRPGERLSIEAKVGADRATSSLKLPGTAAVTAKAEPSGLLPTAFLHGWWGALILGLAVGLLVLAAAAFMLSVPRGSRLKARIAPHTDQKKNVAGPKTERDRLAMAAGLFRVTERTFAHQKFWRKLSTQLDRADMPLRTVELLYAMFGCALVCGLIAATFGPPFLILLGALAGGAFLPYAFIVVRARRRLKAFDAQLPDLLTTVAASLKAGHSFRQGIQAIVDEGQEPSSKEFQRVLTETRLGRPMDGALAEMSRRVGSKNLEFVLTAVTIQRQVGGSLAAIFDMVAETVRNRHQFARKVKGLTAMGRASAYVLIALPFFVALAVTAINAEYMAPLYHSSTGHHLLLVGVGMIFIGSLFLKRIVSFKG
jgi:tight adherence protein B